ncbi:ABC transporter permease [Thermopolyspora sp. NPDC052614]|uniref:ABC transporter permease n=1 Tax=Thermopolyspora sp. NPDC052614 TaxID=3155682 RepID=UPI003428ADBC
MKGLTELSWRLLRGGGRQGLLGTGLTVAAVAVSTALLLFALTANLAFAARADRDAWRHPVAADGEPIAIQATHEDYVRDSIITVVDIAPLRETAAHPPGLDRMPRPGELWVSPALAALLRELPPAQLAERFPGRVTGMIGDAGLVYPGEPVAVVGRAPTDPVMTAPASPYQGSSGPTKISGFTGETGDVLVAYRILALIAAVLMVVPLLVFGGAAARLTVARRDQRLAALRLVGATPGQVAWMTVAEAMIAAFAGAVLGLVLYGAAVPLLSRIEMAGGPWYAADLWPGFLPVLGVLLAVPLLVGVSAAVGLRRVVVSPLGVAKRQSPPGLRLIRVIVLLAVLAVVPLVFTRSKSAAVVAVVLALAFLCVNLVGPWVVAVIGRITASSARNPAALLAGRRLVDDPRSAWRTVAGVALTGFVAGFIGLLSPSADVLGTPSTTDLTVQVPAARADAFAGQAKRRLAEAGVVEATVELGGQQKGKRERDLLVALPARASQAQVDTARTALAGLSPGRIAVAPADQNRQGVILLADLRTGTVIVLGVSFLVAIASAGITAASSVIDRRQTYALLRLAGTPLEVLDRARRTETLIPLAVMGGGSILVGVFCALPFVHALIDVSGIVILLTTIVVGVAGILGASALSRPLLRSVTLNPAPRPD